MVNKLRQRTPPLTRRDALRRLVGGLTGNGCKPLDVRFVNRQGVPHDGINFSTAHQVGSCRMANSKSQGVCGADGEVFGYPGLFVTDGAAIPTSLAVNTSLTILANAERIVDGILVRLGKLGRPSIAAAAPR